MTIKFGVVGCGRISPRHFQSIAELENAKLAGVADIIPSRAERPGKEYSVDAYTDLRYLLDRKDIDIINICTPSGLHPAMAIEALKAGKHVIVEKPMALNLQDADEMIQTAQSMKRKLCVVLQNRYNPPMLEIKKVVDEGKIGRILLGNATVRWYRPQNYYEDGWHGTIKMDGGALMNQSIHHIDALQWLMGMPESVVGYKATLAHKMEAEDTGVAIMRFSNGSLAIVEGSTVTYPENLEGSVAIFGERGSVKVGGTALNRKGIWKIENEMEKENLLIRQDITDPPSVYGSSHKAVISDMISAILEDRDPRTNGYEGKKSVQIVLAIYESAEKRKEVFLASNRSSNANP